MDDSQSSSNRNPFVKGNSFDRPGTEPQSSQPQIISTPDQIPAAQPIVQTSVSSNDITLGAQPTKKSKAPVIIALIVAVLAIGALAFFLFAPTSRTSASARVSFNRYANYLLYGTDSENDIEGGYDDVTIYAIDSARSSSDAETFINHAEGLLNEFKAVFEKSNNLPDDNANTIQSYFDNFALIKTYIVTKPLPSSDILTYYNQHGLASTKEYVTSRYDEVAHSDFSSVKEYAKSIVQYDNQIVAMVDKAHAAGCITENTFNDACMANVDISAENSIADTASANATDFLQTAEDSIVKDCWTISNILKGEA